VGEKCGGSGAAAPYAPCVTDDQAARERELRRRARNDRRASKGKETWDTDWDLEERWPVALDLSEQPTMIISPQQLRERLPPREERRGQTAAETIKLEGGWPEPASAEAPPPSDRRSRARSTAIFGAATALSRVMGLVREVVAAALFGGSGRINAFVVAFQVPNLIRALVADAALSSAFVPVFSDLIEQGQRRRAWRVASSLFWLMLLGLSGLTGLFILVAPHVIGLFGDPGHDRPLAIGLARVMFPLVVLLGVSGIVVGILNTYEHFTVPAISPVFWNLAIIAGIAIGVPQAHTMSTKLYVYAASILVATFIQVLLPFPWLRGLDGGRERLRVVIDWRDPAVWSIFRGMVPVTLGLGLINVNALIDTYFASRYIDPGLAPNAIQKAFLIYMLPQGVFSVAVATVLFPTLARLASRGDTRGFAEAVSEGLRQITFLLAPAAVVTAVLATPIVRLLYQHGKWGPHATAVTGGALAAFSAGLVFNGAMLLLNRAFFSLRENWVPTAVALGNLVLNGILDAVFYRFGTWGIPLSTAVVNVAGVIALAVLLRRRIGSLGGSELSSVLVRITFACVGVAAVSWFVWHPLDALVGRSFPGQLASVGAALVAASAVYLAACRALRVREIQALTALLRR
jgi:putative peptidoglycan lipid II flippase